MLVHYVGPPLRARVIAGESIVTAMGVTVAAGLLAWLFSGGWLLPLVVLGAAGIAAIVFMRRTLRKIRFSRRGAAVSWLGRRRFIPWSDVIDCRYSNGLRLTTRHGRTVLFPGAASAFLVGTRLRFGEVAGEAPSVAPPRGGRGLRYIGGRLTLAWPPAVFYAGLCSPVIACVAMLIHGGSLGRTLGFTAVIGGLGWLLAALALQSTEFSDEGVSRKWLRHSAVRWDDVTDFNMGRDLVLFTEEGSVQIGLPPRAAFALGLRLRNDAPEPG